MATTPLGKRNSSDKPASGGAGGAGGAGGTMAGRGSAREMAVATLGVPQVASAVPSPLRELAFPASESVEFFSMVNDGSDHGEQTDGVPRASGYVSIRHSSYLSGWKTRWIVLTGNYLRTYRTQDYANANKTIYLAGCELKENAGKYHFKVKPLGKKKGYELRTRDKRDFDLWHLALHKAQSWKDPREGNNPPPPLSRTESEDSLDEIEDGADGPAAFPDADVDPIASQWTEDQYKAEEKSRKQRLTTSIQSMTQALNRLEKRFGPDAAALHTALHDVLKGFNEYSLVLESERDMWRAHCLDERRRATVLDTNLESLAKDHRRLEMATAAVRKPTSCSGHGVARPLSDEPRTGTESEDEFYDALEVSASASAVARASLVGGLERTLSAGKVEPVAVELAPTAPVPSAVSIVRRDRLPSDKSPTRPSLWAVLKNSIGKDLSKMALPIIFNEPLSALQRWAEDLEYAYLLDQAATATSDAERMALVSVFQISNYSSTMIRVYKPFNPILGETYECQRPERGVGWQYIAEQVSHHPPVSACYANATGNLWQWWQTVQVNTFFRGKDLDVQPKGVCHIRFPQRNNEHITFRKVTTCVRNVVVGKQWVDNYGESRVVNHATGYYAVLQFRPYSFLAGVVADVEGKVFNKADEPVYWIKGNWNRDVAIAPAADGPWTVVWTKSEVPTWSEAQYNFTGFAMTLNEMEPDQTKLAAPTDCRFRPDQRMFEEGLWDEAQREKERLEDKQRAARRLREASGQLYKPQHFEQRPDSDLNNDALWMYTDSYWDRRNSGLWAGLPDLYGKDES